MATPTILAGVYEDLVIDGTGLCGHNDHTNELTWPEEQRGRRPRAEVRKGRTLVITDRGEPVAELRPVSLGGAGSKGEIDRLVALGHLTRTSKGPLAPFRPIRLNGHPVSEAIVEDRENRF